MRFLRSPWFLLLILPVGAGVLWRYVIADWLAERRWKEYEADARARGLRWLLAEYQPASVPEAEDAALLPVFTSTSEYKVLLKQIPVPVKGRKTKDGTPRPIDWSATRAKLSELGINDDASETDDLRALDSAARNLQPLIEQLWSSKATAGNWGDAVWKADLTSKFDHSFTLVRCIAALEFRGRLDLALGRGDQARRSVEAQLRLSRIARGLPTVINHMFALSAETKARETVCEGMQSGAWDDAALRAFLDYFRDSDELRDIQWSMETERAWSRAVQNTLAADPTLVLQVLSFSGSSLSQIDEWMLRMAISRPAWHLKNQMWYERAQDELAKSIDVDAGVWRPMERQFDSAKLAINERKLDLALAAQSMSMMDSFTRRAVWIHAQNKMAAIACALELERRASGKYPATLGLLVPEYLPKLPIDPATGGLFRYAVQPDGYYRLYSVGFDGKNQGGDVSTESDRDTADPDWPWFGPRSESGRK